jgi:hypothetical protein
MVENQNQPQKKDEFKIEKKFFSQQGDVDISQIFDSPETKRKRNQISLYWQDSKTRKEHLKNISKETGIPEQDLLYKVRGDSPKSFIYYGHPRVAEAFEKWCKEPNKQQVEQEIKERLKKKYGGWDEEYCVTDVGIIDVLTETLLIEIKFFKNWKEAVGQLILYGLQYPNHQKILHLFGDFRRQKGASRKLLDSELIKSKCEDLKQVCKDCKFLDIQVQLEEELGTDISE